MSLVVFDMGRRVETPVRPDKNRINPTLPSHAVSAIQGKNQEANQQGTPYRQDNHSHQHQPQPVAYVKDIMQRKVRWVSDETTIGSAWKLMQSTGFHHLPVIDADLKVCAILSDRDLLEHNMRSTVNWQDNILRFASRPVLCISEEADIRQCARTLLEYQIGALPVVNNEQLLCGIITRTDILQVISHYGPMELWA